MLVDMERSYITSGFFRDTMYTRFDKNQQQSVAEYPVGSMVVAADRNLFPTFGTLFPYDPDDPAKRTASNGKRPGW